MHRLEDRATICGIVCGVESKKIGPWPTFVEAISETKRLGPYYTIEEAITNCGYKCTSKAGMEMTTKLAVISFS